MSPLAAPQEDHEDYGNAVEVFLEDVFRPALYRYWEMEDDRLSEPEEEDNHRLRNFHAAEDDMGYFSGPGENDSVRSEEDGESLAFTFGQQPDD